MNKILSLLALLALGPLASGPIFAQAATPTTGYISRLEVHVATAEIRFRVTTGSNQLFCGSAIEAFFPLTAGSIFGPLTYSQNVIDALKSSAYAARASAIEVDVYAVSTGAACLVTDIVLR